MKTYAFQGKSVNESLELLLIRARLKSHEFVSRASIDQTLMVRWRQGYQSLGLERYKRAAKVLGVSFEQMPLVANEMLLETHGTWYRLGAFRSSDEWIARVDELDVGNLPPETVNGRVGMSLPYPLDPEQADSANLLAPMNFRWEGHGRDAAGALSDLAMRIDQAISTVLARLYLEDHRS